MKNKNTAILHSNQTGGQGRLPFPRTAPFGLQVHQNDAYYSEKKMAYYLRIGRSDLPVLTNGKHPKLVENFF